jgi:hypothetical protein
MTNWHDAGRFTTKNREVTYPKNLFGRAMNTDMASNPVYVYRTRDRDTVILMNLTFTFHPDLQRKLVQMLEETGRQVVGQLIRRR